MWIIGLTGSMGAGKSTLARAFQQEGVPVHGSDEEIHDLFEQDGEIKKEIRDLWPEAFEVGKISRQKLRQRVLSSPYALSQLEKILYPRLLKKQKKFLQFYQKSKCSMVVLDVPLLFETGLDRYCHFVIVVSSPTFLREKRVLRRRGVTSQDFEKLESNQFSSCQKEMRADVVIHTGRDKGSALKETKRILMYLKSKPIPRWSGRWSTELQREPYEQRNRSRYGNNWI